VIPLVCGNPAEEPASYTRFVLPFSYSPTRCPPKELSWVYKPSKPASIWRKNYLTVETATVLFDRAKWLELKSADTIPDFQIRRGERHITVRIGTPRLVLFEWPSDPTARREGDQKDILCIGFLIVEASFPKKEESGGLDDLLEIGIGGSLPTSLLPHHLAYGSVPRRFGKVKCADETLIGTDLKRRRMRC